MKKIFILLLISQLSLAQDSNNERVFELTKPNSSNFLIERPDTVGGEK